MSSRIFVLLLLFNLVFFTAVAQESASFAIQWQKWEYVFLSDGQVDTEDKAPVHVEVEFQGPGKDFKVPAFTDDGIHYTVRAAFPATGSWRWRSSAGRHSDHGIHNVRGRVEVTSYKGDNPLYLNGDLRVSENARYLEHADGTPFLWLGDSGWDIIRKASVDEWKEYIDTRSEQGFNVIQVNPRGTGNKNAAAENPEISFTPEGLNDTVFWNALEKKIQYANEKGIFILLAGTGTAWRDRMALNIRNQKFAPYISGRMSGLMVIFSPGFEQPFSDDIDRLTADLKAYSTHLITQYPVNTQQANNTFRMTTSVDFTGLNIGSHNGDNAKIYNSVRQWTIDMFSGAPVKPIITIRSVYDGYGNENGKSFRGSDARKTGWITILSGSRGYTYGAGELPPVVPGGKGAVWAFNKDSSAYDYWRKALRWESAGQMRYLRDFLKSTYWWELIPSQDLIRNQETADTLQMVAARTFDTRLIVSYLPLNPRIVLNMINFPGVFRYHWYNPKTGETTQPEKFNGGNPNQLFVKPEGWEDAALMIIGNE